MQRIGSGQKEDFAGDQKRTGGQDENRRWWKRTRT
jgi:hypothetical protein